MICNLLITPWSCARVRGKKRWGCKNVELKYMELVELKDCARVPGLALTSRRLSWVGLFGLHQAYNVPGWVIAIYCLNYSPSPWTGWNSESCFGAKPIKP